MSVWSTTGEGTPLRGRSGTGPRGSRRSAQSLRKSWASWVQEMVHKYSGLWIK